MAPLPATPYLRVDEARLRANIAAMAGRARELGVALRPHVKTHKSLEIARLQLDAGASGVTVATIGEAEVFAAVADDILIAYPLWLDAGKAARVAALSERVALTLGVDSVPGARNTAERLGADAGRVSVLVEVDSGHHRSGVAPGDAGGVAQAARDSGLDVAGVFTFPGHSYAVDGGRERAAAQEAEALSTAARSLAEAGVEPRVVSGGSSPSMAFATAGVVTEMRPGVYVFGDAQQWELGSCDADDIALTCVATVVSHAGGRAVLDAGSKILGADRAPWASGYGRLPGDPDARIVICSEHHAVVETDELPPLGSTVEVAPNHACNAVNLVDELVRDDGSRWTVDARGRNA